MKILKYFLFLLSVRELYTWKVFHRGRYFKGNLNFFNNDTNKTTRTFNEKWVTQQLDHFNPNDCRTWKQRYFADDQYYNPSSGGPVFLLIGGESAIEDYYMTFSWITYAKKFGALCFVLEHRYYGKSRPTIDMSTRNLQFLNSEQALADSASFIQEMNKKYNLPSNVKWFTFGGSYAGSLAAWLRLKYPDLVYGAISSSGPLLAQVDFRGYYKVVAESLRTNSQECVDEIQKAFLEVDHLLRSKNGQIHLTKIFELFEPIEMFVHNINTVQNLYRTLAEHFAGLVQHHAFEIDSTCRIMTNSMVKKPVDRLATVIKGFPYRYDEMISALRATNWNNKYFGMRQWTYQTCTEFGFYQTTSEPPHVFGNKVPVELYIQECSDVFGPQFDSLSIYNAVNRTNSIYHGLDINASNIVFVHGSMDPWHSLGITATKHEQSPAIYIQGTSHCVDMYPEEPSDLPQLKAARQKIVQYLSTWIAP